MRTFIIVSLIVVLVTVNADYAKESNEENNKIIAECRKKFKMTDEEYSKMRNDVSAKPTENFQCLVNCFMEAVGKLKDGKYQPDVVIQRLTPKVGKEKAKAIAELCRGESGSTNCETAYKLQSCLMINEAH